MDSRKCSSNAGLVCKLDIEKTYYDVSWKFFLSISEKIGIRSEMEIVDPLLYFFCEIDISC